MAINWGKLLDVGVRTGVPIITAAVGASQAKKAGKAGEEAARLEANALKEAAARSDAQYAQTREDFEPWREAGVNALKRYEDLTIRKNCVSTSRACLATTSSAAKTSRRSPTCIRNAPAARAA